MTDVAAILQSEPPSVELISGQQREDHTDQFPCCEHQCPFILVMNRLFEFTGVKCLKSRIGHLDQLTPQSGIARPRKRSIFRIKGRRLVAPPYQPRIFRLGVVQRESGKGSHFDHNSRTIDTTHLFSGDSMTDYSSRSRRGADRRPLLVPLSAVMLHRVMRWHRCQGCSRKRVATRALAFHQSVNHPIFESLLTPACVPRGAGETSVSRPDQIPYHRSELAMQDNYFQIGLGWDAVPNPHPNPGVYIIKKQVHSQYVYTRRKHDGT